MNVNTIPIGRVVGRPDACSPPAAPPSLRPPITPIPAPIATVAANRPGALVDTGSSSRQRARESDVAEGVPGKDLPSQHHEPAADPAGQGDEGPGEQRVAHEFL